MSVVVVTPDRHGVGARVEGDRIVSWGEDPDPRDAMILDAADATLQLGAINAHTHLYSGLVPLGMPAPEPQPENFLQILERVWWRLDRALDADTLRAAARLYVAEALLMGTTTLVDHHESPAFIDGSLDVLAEACEELGCRAVLTYGATERNGGRDEGQRGLDACADFIRGNTRPLVRGLVGLHASFTVSDETIRAAGALCQKLDVPMHVHVAEDGADVADAKERGYPGPLERLMDLGALPGSILAHGVHLAEDQVRRAHEHGLWFVQNPRSNRGNRVGFPEALRVTDRVALGTDGYPADMSREATVLAEDLEEYGPGTEGNIELLDQRTRGGNRLAGELLDLRFTPDPGSAADLVVQDREGVRHVVVDGVVVVREGRLTRADYDEVLAQAESAAAALWERMAGLP